jgi:Xaa-Pro aminopeptidase
MSTGRPEGTTFEPVADLFQNNFSTAELAGRRKAVLARIGDAVAVVQGAGVGMGMGLFRQTNEFYYLCGVEVPHSYLLMDGLTGTTTLYLPHRDPVLEASDGRRLSAEDGPEVARLTGVDAVGAPEAFAMDVQRLVLKRPTVVCYTPFAPAEQERSSRDQLLRARAAVASDGWAEPQCREGHFALLLRTRFPKIELRDLSPVLDELRLVKSDREAELCRVAGHLSAVAVNEAMCSTAPGVLEYELGAVAALCFGLGGARGEGYRGIIASGHNTWFGHYGRQGDALRDGDLVLMDYAPDVAYYTSDIGRMWPVNGKYSPLQRSLYGFMVDYHKELLSRVRPGAVPGDILAESAEVMRERLEGISFPDECYRKAATATLSFRGHLSHPVGMAVHDVGDYTAAPLVPGTVFSIDPQMWVPEKDTYIRVEDTVLVTADGVEVMTSAAPLELDDVEALMREPGLLQVVQAARMDRR